jgi:hypothetical protein
VKELYDAWLNRKLAREPFRPLREWVVSRHWRRKTGRELFGGVTLRVRPAESFVFESACVWPGSKEEFEESILDGILDALLVDLTSAPGAAAFVLEAIEWRGDSSVPRAYYMAAREAVGEAFALNEQERLRVADRNVT